MFRIESYVGRVSLDKKRNVASPEKSQEISQESSDGLEVEARRFHIGQVAARLVRPFSYHDLVSRRDITLRRSAVLLGAVVATATPKIGLVDDLDATPKEAAQNMVSDIKDNADPKHVVQLRGAVVLSSGQHDILKIRPSITTGTFETDDVKERIAPEQQLIVKNPLLVKDNDDGDVKLIVQIGEDTDNGYGAVAVDFRTNTNIDMSGVRSKIPVSLSGLRATDEGTIIGENLVPVGTIHR
jgi:hypothetical protein